MFDITKILKDAKIIIKAHHKYGASYQWKSRSWIHSVSDKHFSAELVEKKSWNELVREDCLTIKKKEAAKHQAGKK